MDLSTEEYGRQAGVDGTVDVEFHGRIAILTMRCGENRTNVDYVLKMNKALDKVEKNPAIEVLITTGEGRFYGNGLDLNWLGSIAVTPTGPQKFLEFRDNYLQPLYQRVLTFPMPTIAAINGHCFAAAGILALCHDYSIMNTEKGWFCLNEVHTGMRFNGMMYQILRCRLPSGRPFHEATALGKKYSGKELQKDGIAIQAVPMTRLLPEAKALATKLETYTRESIQQMKKDMYRDIIAAQEEIRGKDDVNMVYLSKL